MDFKARTALDDFITSFDMKTTVPSHMIVNVILRNMSNERHLKVIGPNH